MTKVNRTYKDTLFRLLFNDRKNLLSLYNAVNHTNYTNVEDLEINTLENAIYLKVKNDVSFVFNFYLNLYEHQASLNPNMPLRDLFYVSDLLQAITAEENIYSSSLITIPTPRFVVFFNGDDDMPEKMVLRLSDSFSHWEEEPELELKVVVYNINKGMNQDLLESCQTLKEYAQFVQMFRENLRQYEKETAAKVTIDTCIKENILSDFFRKHQAEAMAMCLYEYDEEKHMEMERREHYERGLADGIAQGERVGEKRGRKEGERIGEKRGKREGKQEAKREIILHMLSQNQPPKIISELTGEPLSFIEKLNSSDK